MRAFLRLLLSLLAALLAGAAPVATAEPLLLWDKAPAGASAADIRRLYPEAKAPEGKEGVNRLVLACTVTVAGAPLREAVFQFAQDVLVAVTLRSDATRPGDAAEADFNRLREHLTKHMGREDDFDETRAASFTPPSRVTCRWRSKPHFITLNFEREDLMHTGLVEVRFEPAPVEAKPAAP